MEFDELISGLDPISKLLYTEVMLGEDVKIFIKSDAGAYLVGCAKQEFVSALLDLKDVAWWRRGRIRQLQNQARRAEDFLAWLREGLARGRQAESQLKETDHDA